MRIPLVLLIALTFAACTPPPAPSVPVRADSIGVEPEIPDVEPSDLDGTQALAENRRRWEAQRPDHYRFRYTRICFCPPQYRGPFSVTVRGDEAVEIAYEGEGEPVEDALADAARTVDDIFDVIADAYARDAVSVRVTYVPQTGQPTDVTIDYDEQIADEEVGFTIEPIQTLDG